MSSQKTYTNPEQLINGKTELQHAICNQQLAQAKALLHQGAKLETMSSEGKIAQDYATETGDQDFTTLLTLFTEKRLLEAQRSNMQQSDQGYWPTLTRLQGVNTSIASLGDRERT